VTHLAVHAAEAAVSAGQPGRAVELLERTRGVLVASELDRRAGHDHQAPLTIAELGDIASDGPVVYLNAGILRCDALALVAPAGSAGPPAVRHIPLAVSPSDVEDKARRLLTLVGLEPIEEQIDIADPVVQQEMLAILGWLREQVTGPVLAAFGYDRVPADERGRPRIWWCPVGDFTFLPLHATCLDEVVSSYAFTARSLRQARSQPLPGAHPASGPLVIAVPDAPGAAPLPGADLEAEVIGGIFPDAIRLPRPIKKAVLDALPGHPVVHFACHGAVDPEDPGHSQLFLEDHAEAPLTVSDIGALRLPGGLAFLSACETAVTNGNLRNEAVHLTGAFQLAGYRHVVGTFWQVGDLASAMLVVLPAVAAASMSRLVSTSSTGVEHLAYAAGPYTITPGANLILAQTNEVAKPDVNGFMIRMAPNLRYALPSGKLGSVPPTDVVHLHHGVWITNGAAGQGEGNGFANFYEFMAAGEEKTIYEFPAGYGYPIMASDVWILNYMIHNLTNITKYVYVTYDMDFVPETDTALASKITPN